MSGAVRISWMILITLLAAGLPFFLEFLFERKKKTINQRINKK